MVVYELFAEENEVFSNVTNVMRARVGMFDSVEAIEWWLKHGHGFDRKIQFQYDKKIPYAYIQGNGFVNFYVEEIPILTIDSYKPKEEYKRPNFDILKDTKHFVGIDGDGVVVDIDPYAKKCFIDPLYGYVVRDKAASECLEAYLDYRKETGLEFPSDTKTSVGPHIFDLNDAEWYGIEDYSADLRNEHNPLLRASVPLFDAYPWNYGDYYEERTKHD